MQKSANLSSINSIFFSNPFLSGMNFLSYFGGHDPSGPPLWIRYWLIHQVVEAKQIADISHTP